MNPVVVLAWWDPKNRRVILDDSTIVGGVLVAGTDGVTFAAAHGIAFEAGPAGLHLSWSRRPGRFHLHTPGATYRLGLAPPTGGSPRLSRDALRSIAGHLTTPGHLAALVRTLARLGLLGDAPGAEGHAGHTIKPGHGFAALLRARRSRAALTEQFAVLAERR